MCQYPCVSMCALACVAVFEYLEIHLCVCRKHRKMKPGSLVMSLCVSLTCVATLLCLCLSACVCVRLCLYSYLSVYICVILRACQCGYFLCACVNFVHLCVPVFVRLTESVFICGYSIQKALCVCTRVFDCLCVRVHMCLCSYVSVFISVRVTSMYALVDAYVRVCLNVRVPMFVCVRM